MSESEASSFRKAYSEAMFQGIAQRPERKRRQSFNRLKVAFSKVEGPSSKAPLIRQGQAKRAQDI